MVKYRLTWQGTGVLDLSQVADETGMPVLFARPGDSVVVSAGTFQHPLVKNYVGNGLMAERLSPVVEPPPPLPPRPPLLPSPPAPPVEFPRVEPAPPTAPVSEVSPVVEASPEPVATPPAAATSLGTPEEPPRGRSGRGPRGRAR